MTDRPVIVSLSTIPPRMPMIGPVLDSLMAQTLRPARVVLVIPATYRRFPDWDGTLPRVPPGVEVLRVPHDLGPATKVLPMARSLRGQAVDLVYCDDDCRLNPGWLAALHAVAREDPDCAVATMGFDLSTMATAPRRADRLPRLSRIAEHPCEPPAAGFADIAMGHGGVAVKPDWFPDAAFAIPPEVWTVDDIWLSGWLESQGIGIRIDTRVPAPATLRDLHGTHALWHATIEGRDRTAANRAAIDWWRARGIWPLPPSVSVPGSSARAGGP